MDKCTEWSDIQLMACLRRWPGQHTVDNVASQHFIKSGTVAPLHLVLGKRHGSIYTSVPGTSSTVLPYRQDSPNLVL